MKVKIYNFCLIHAHGGLVVYPQCHFLVEQTPQTHGLGDFILTPHLEIFAPNFICKFIKMPIKTVLQCTCFKMTVLILYFTEIRCTTPFGNWKKNPAGPQKLILLLIFYF